jgi:hypothetical protein
MNKQTKRTAANTPFLAACKRLFNKPIYAMVTNVVNERGNVEDCICMAKVYLRLWGMPTDPAAVLAKIEAQQNQP